MNPACGREGDYGIGKADVKKNVVIVGGGVAGCEAARVCAERGHTVTVLEKADRLGGNLIPAGVPDFKENDHKLADWYTHQLSKLWVDVRLNTEANLEMVKSLNPDVVLVATGSVAKTFPLEGSLPKMNAIEAQMGTADCGDNPVIMGGGLVGCEMALWLLKAGKKPTIVEFMPKILATGAIPFPNKDMLEKLLAFHNCTIYTGTGVTGTGDGVVYAKRGEEELTIPASALVYAVGFNSNRSLFDELSEQLTCDTYLLGDARKVQNVMRAVWDAYEVARNI